METKRESSIRPKLKTFLHHLEMFLQRSVRIQCGVSLEAIVKVDS